MKQVQLLNVFRSLICAVTSLAKGTASDPVFVSGVTGVVETPLTIEDTASGGTGTTPSGAKSFSILFEGSGGELNGVAVISGYISSSSASLGNTLSTQDYTVPTTTDTFFPDSPRVVITYVE